MLHGTPTPLRTWFWAAYLVSTHHSGMQLQRQLALSCYETAWLMLQKLRRAMVAPERVLLRGEAERAARLFAAVRDEVRYDPSRLPTEPAA